MIYLKNCKLLPFLKGSEDPSLPESYRPISLLSTNWKLLKNDYRTDFIGIWKNTNLLSSIQAGFRHNRSTIDQLVRLEHCIQYGLKEKRVVLYPTHSKLAEASSLKTI